MASLFYLFIKITKKTRLLGVCVNDKHFLENYINISFISGTPFIDKFTQILHMRWVNGSGLKGLVYL